MIEDSEIVDAFADVGATRSSGSPGFAYELRDFRRSPGGIDVEVVQRSGLRARLRLDLPSSGRPQPWLYAPPRDASDWVQQLFIWLDEEVHTGGLGPSRVRVEDAGQSYVVVEPYGWRVADREWHERLAALAGPVGWRGDVRG